MYASPENAASPPYDALYGKPIGMPACGRVEPVTMGQSRDASADSQALTKREGGKETTMTDYDNFGEPWLLDRTPASGDAYDPALDREHA